MKKELLAPAGDIEAGYAALYYGADAVYLGLQQFSARATAANFNEENLRDFVGYAHHLGRKVFAAVNTLVQENELSDLLKTLDICSCCRVDAVIIQDLGTARIIREQYPELEMHASTQMAVHNKEGALALQRLGFSRVVVARELSLPEIKEIAAIPGLETEAFIHGALCYSYSGLCLFSSMESGKSANRGKCLYPCRAAFVGESGERHYFSMKDMALQEDVLKMPVTSLKIEGRKKTALYVAAVTDYYRHILDGDGADVRKEEHIRQIFSRPWCKFHFNGKNKEVIDRNFVGHRGLFIGKIASVQNGKLMLVPTHKIARFDGIQIDVPGEERPFGFSLQNLRVGGKNVFEAEAGTAVEIHLPPKAPALKKGYNVYLASSTAVKGAYPYEHPKAGAYKPRHSLEVSVEITPGKLMARAEGFEAMLEGNFPPAEVSGKVAEAVKKAFGKTGDTLFELVGITVENPNGLFVPVSQLNDLRRALYGQIVLPEKQGVLPETEARVLPRKSGKIIKTDKVSNLGLLDFSEIDELVILLSPDFDPADLKKLPKNKVRLALSAVCRRPKQFEPLIAGLLGQGYKKWEIGNYWGLSVLPRHGIDLSFDTPLYAMNSQAVQEAKTMGAGRVTLALEDTLQNWQELAQVSPLPVVLVVYQDVPLFTSAACIRDNDCKNCPRGKKWMELQKNGEKYMALSENCQIMLFAEKPFCAAAEAASVRADFYRADFCYKDYSPTEVKAIWDSVMSGRDVSACRKGNIFRRI